VYYLQPPESKPSLPQKSFVCCPDLATLFLTSDHRLTIPKYG